MKELDLIRAAGVEPTVVVGKELGKLVDLGDRDAAVKMRRSSG